MYTIESTRRRISAMGVNAFTQWLLDAHFSEEEKDQLENLHIMENGIPNLSAICLLAQ